MNIFKKLNIFKKNEQVIYEKILVLITQKIKIRNEIKSSNLLQ